MDYGDTMTAIRNHVLLACILLLTACAGTAGDVVVSIPAYQPLKGTSTLAGLAPTAIQLGAFRRSVGTGQLPGRIGERKTIGDISLGKVTIQPVPGRLVRDAFSSELKAAGHRIVKSAGSALIQGEVQRFALRTDVTAVYWDVILEATVSVLVKKGSVQRTSTYSAVCKERTYAWPGEDIIARVIGHCLADLSGKFRNDKDVARVLASNP